MPKTAYQSYQKPIDDLNAHYDREENVWDGRLSDREMAENGLQKQLQRVGSDLNIWEIGDEKRWRLLDLLTEHQSYPKAVELFLKEEDDDRQPD